MFLCQIIAPVPNVENEEDKGEAKAWKDINFLSSKLKISEQRYCNQPLLTYISPHLYKLCNCKFIVYHSVIPHRFQEKKESE